MRLGGGACVQVSSYSNPPRPTASLRPAAGVRYAWALSGLNKSTPPIMRARTARTFVFAASGFLVAALVLASVAFVLSQRGKTGAVDAGDEPNVSEPSPVAGLDTTGARPAGMALFARASELARVGDNAGALVAFEQSVEEWEARPWTVPEESRHRGRLFGKQLTLLSLEKGDAQQALRFLSAGARASGRPFSALREYHARLDAATRGALWPEAPYIVLCHWGAADAAPPVFFGAARDVAHETQIEPVGEGTEYWARVSVSSGEGRACFGIPAMVDLASGALGFRVRVRAEKPVPVSMAVRFWFPRAKREETYLSTSAELAGEQWTALTLEDDFLKYCYERSLAEGFDMSDGCIDRVGIAVATEPNTYWLDEPEMYVPEAAGANAPVPPQTRTEGTLGSAQ